MRNKDVKRYLLAPIISGYVRKYEKGIYRLYYILTLLICVTIDFIRSGSLANDRHYLNEPKKAYTQGYNFLKPAPPHMKYLSY